MRDYSVNQYSVTVGSSLLHPMANWCAGLISIDWLGGRLLGGGAVHELFVAAISQETRR